MAKAKPRQKTAALNGEAPSVTLAVLSGGDVTYTVRATGKDLGDARKEAWAAFTRIRRDLKKLTDGELAGTLRKSVERAKK